MQKANRKDSFSGQPLPAGIKQNDNIEFFGDRASKKVQWFQNGIKKNFDQLPPKVFALLSNAYNQDKPAKEILNTIGAPTIRQVELYTYYLWGSLDHAPDIKNGQLQPAENFRDSANCISLDFGGKEITIEGVPINKRDLAIIDLIAQDAPDKAIAAALCVSVPTLGFHKKNLFTKTNTQTKTGLLAKSFRANIIS